jgi:3-hydroxybutyryl-CoA dehydratase
LNVVKQWTEGVALPGVRKIVTQAMIDRYAEASGDFNPVHLDKEFASLSQFGSTIAHGMMIASMVSQTMTEAFQDKWMETGKLKLRFKAPVRPGETVQSYGMVKHVDNKHGEKGSLICSVGVKKQNGEDVINGEARVAAPD